MILATATQQLIGFCGVFAGIVLFCFVLGVISGWMED